MIHRNPEHLPAPPPLELQLVDFDRPIGWIHSNRVGFSGFGSEEEAMGAAAVAEHAMQQRLARRLGVAERPRSDRALSLDRSTTPPHVLLGNEAIATLIAPADPEGGDGFGFEVVVPGPGDELTMRSTAYMLYRALRRSGVPWRAWREHQDRTAESLELVPVTPARPPVARGIQLTKRTALIGMLVLSGAAAYAVTGSVMSRGALVLMLAALLALVVGFCLELLRPGAQEHWAASHRTGTRRPPAVAHRTASHVITYRATGTRLSEGLR